MNNKIVTKTLFEHIFHHKTDIYILAADSSFFFFTLCAAIFPETINRIQLCFVIYIQQARYKFVCLFYAWRI